ncbi:hypothetical protein [Curtobacterium sp. MCBD17_003]|uniref:hypothetical protein n=1 Tax=Curtobacterium sp. MCBD17_003 TaxID=2175667 RepID=UPI000DA97F4F|nr:hypothetical protein [Curtobacterium sp. MCBD17_003]WIE55630.1 hypothetical protein DEI88_005370 [Curtobacterium sp. MCBD17_003]
MKIRKRIIGAAALGAFALTVGIAAPANAVTTTQSHAISSSDGNASAVVKVTWSTSETFHINYTEADTAPDGNGPYLIYDVAGAGGGSINYISPCTKGSGTSCSGTVPSDSSVGVTDVTVWLCAGHAPDYGTHCGATYSFKNPYYSID